MIVKLRMQNFLPFREPVELPLAGQGLVLVKGKNLVSGALDSNGAGKTSIGHAVSFCLFGEDLVGRRADAVACRFSGEATCAVTLELEDALGRWKITRTRRPAALYVDGIPGIGENEDMASVQPKIEQRLGFGIRTFKNAVVFGQGTFERFAGADQAEQMRMLDEIQGVDFRDALARAKSWRLDLQEKLVAEQRTDATAAAQIDAASRSAAHMRHARDGHEASRRERLVAMEAQLDSAKIRLEAANREVKEAASLAAVLQSLRLEEKVEQDLDAEESKARMASDSAKVEEDAAASSEKDLRDRLDELMESGTCPSCMRSTARAQEKAIRKLFQPELVKLSAARLKTEAATDRALVALKRAVDRHARQLAKLKSLVPVEGWNADRYVMALEERLGTRAAQQREAAVQRALDDAARLSLECARVENEPWSGQQALDSAVAMIAGFQEARRVCAERTARIAAAIKMADYAHEAFGDRGIRSMLVDGVAEYVNAQIAKHLEVLACGEATVKMSAQTELKKGGARERISFNSEWAWGGAGAGSGSGGQDRRKDLAVFAAVQDLAEARGARPFPLKIWDEPGDALDARGQELFLEWVRGQARDRGTGLLITHSEGIASQAEPDQTWTVVMDARGARVEIA